LHFNGSAIIAKKPLEDIENLILKQNQK